MPRVKPVGSLAVVEAALLLLAVISGGCTWKSDRAREAEDSAGPADVWRAKASSMRIYPSTRFKSGQRLMEAQVEFFDQMGDSIKAVGRLRLELFAVGPAGLLAPRRLLYTWDVAMMTLADQKRYYNAITRAYLFQLKVDHLPKNLRRTILQAIFYGHDGTRLEAREGVPVKEKEP